VKVNFILQLTGTAVELWEDYAGFEYFNDAQFCRDLHIKTDTLKYRILDVSSGEIVVGKF
jgi:hypothetical protein